MSTPCRRDGFAAGPRRTTRRGFLKGAAAVAGSLLASSLVTGPSTAMARDLLVRTERLGMLMDLTSCIGCRRCEVACNGANRLPAPAVPFDDPSVFEKKRRPGVNAFTVVNRYEDRKRGMPVFRKVQCNHCEEPACVSACLVGAMRKTPEGPVVYNADLCIGCRYCMVSCPFYIPTYEYSSVLEPRVRKCTMCYGRISQGLRPACAEACPVEAITFGNRSDLLKLARERMRLKPGRYVDHIYGESEAGGTSWLYLSGVPFEELDFPTDLGTTPLPEFTREFLSFVPLVLVAWPTLLGGFYLFSNHREQGNSTGRDEPEKEEDR